MACGYTLGRGPGVRSLEALTSVKNGASIIAKTGWIRKKSRTNHEGGKGEKERDQKHRKGRGPRRGKITSSYENQKKRVGSIDGIEATRRKLTIWGPDPEEPFAKGTKDEKLPTRPRGSRFKRRLP